MLKSRSKIVIGAAVACLGIGGLVSPAVAAPTGAQNDAELSATAAALEGADVSSAVQSGLLEKVERGELWDAATAAAPVSTDSRVDGSYQVTRDTYADGSYTEVGVEQGVEVFGDELAEIVERAKPYAAENGVVPDRVVEEVASGGVSTMAAGVENCRFGYSAGVRYADNCHVYYHGITWSNSFDANYQQWSTSSAAQYIEGTAQVVSILAVSNENVLSRENGREIRHQFNLSGGGWGNTPFWLDLRTTPTNAAAYIS